MAVSKGRSSFKKTIQDESKHEKLGDMLRKDGRITGRQLKTAEEIRKKQNLWIGSILISQGYISEEALINFISKNLTIPIFDPKENPVTSQAVKLVEYKAAKENMFVPVKSDDKSIVIAMRDPTNFKAIEFVAETTKLAVKTEVISLQALVAAFKEHYGISKEEGEAFFPKAKKEERLTEEKSHDVSFDLGEIISSAEDELEIAEDFMEEGPDEITAGDAAIVKLVNGILLNAVKKGSSDIHIEPYEKKLRVRYRADGKLSEDMNLPIQMKSALVSRIKIMASLNIAERRVPQDGRIKIRIGGGRVVDFRVSVLPTLFGESVVMRLLDQSKLQVDMTKLGFSEEVLAKFDKAIKSPQGMVLVTGPTGSGKTNTLYSAINALNKEDVKILTVEDPVEFNFEGINQVLVRSEVGMTFAAALRAFLRQDPEIILVGEIRDLETAEIAVKAAMTGHLVFSTLHTNDCPSTIARMVDIGVPGYMLSSSLIMVVAQRLLRRLCTNCKEVVTDYTPKELLDIGFKKEEVENLKVMQGKGCPKCTDGYKGRVGCFEVMEVTETLKQAITAGIPEDQLRKIAIKEGMLTLRRDGLDKVAEGLTTIEEVIANTVLQAESLPAYLLNPDELIFEDGDLIIREGNTDKNFYKLLQGSLVIIKSGRVVGEITQPDEYFGEMSALLNQPRVATIKSRGKSVVKVFPGERLKETLENHPNIALRIIKSLNSRLSEADKLLARVMEKKGRR
jgi:type IV pilus assembly protein PilB